MRASGEDNKIENVKFFLRAFANNFPQDEVSLHLRQSGSLVTSSTYKRSL